MANCITPSPTVIECNNLCNLCNFMKRVLPTSIDDELSDLELFNKMVKWAKLAIQFDEQICAEWNAFQTKFEANIEDTVRDILNQWILDGTLTDIITQVLQSVVNVVLLGVDNTGNEDVGGLITNILSEYTGRKIYFPAGTYKINSTVRMRTDGDFKGNILVCDSDAKFITDGVATMFIFGNGNAASTLERFGFEGGFIDCKNVTECGIKINNNQYSCVINNLLMRNCGNIKGIQLGDGQGTSSQAYLTNITITGDGTVQGDGLLINSTDNYLCNINIGRMKRNLVFGGGGNLCTNVHTWNYGSEYEALGISTPEEKLKYPSITINGSNNFNCVQVDNGTPAVLLTENAIQNRFAGITFNYEKDFPWAKATDKCCCVRVNGQNDTLSNTFEFSGVTFQPTEVNHVSLLKFFRYDRYTTFPFGTSWKFPFYATRENKLRCLECDFGRTIYEKTPCITTNLTVEDETKVFLVGYIGMNFSTMESIYTFYGVEKGEVKVRIVNNNGTITVTSEIIESFANNVSIFIGNSTQTINDFVVVPVYYKSNNTGTLYSSLIVDPTKPLDVFNSFVPNKLPEWIDKPDGVIEVKLYE